MNKCAGCGVLLQSINPDIEGYVRENAKEQNLCERCFRIRHYNEYQKVEKTNEEFLPILDTIAKTNDLMILVVDLFGMNQNIEQLIQHCNSNLLLVFTKRDLLPLSVTNEKLKSYSNQWKVNPLDVFLVSGTKNIGFDELYESILYHQKSRNVYIIGYTNAGKSTLINNLLKHYSKSTQLLTTSMMTSTTLNTIEVPITEELTIFDTPGIIEEGNICDVLEAKQLKKILPKKEIKPITYQIKGKQFIWIEDFCMIEAIDHNMTLFFSNQLKIERFYRNKFDLNHLKQHMIRVQKDEDIVILGLGFIKCTQIDMIVVYVPYGVSVFTRKSLI